MYVLISKKCEFMIVWYILFLINYTICKTIQENHFGTNQSSLSEMNSDEPLCIQIFIRRFCLQINSKRKFKIKHAFDLPKSSLFTSLSSFLKLKTFSFLCNLLFKMLYHYTFLSLCDKIFTCSKKFYQRLWLEVNNSQRHNQ